ncbi:MAG: response regulator transcription factor [Bacteroidales bacterium]|nr:response regulator transcription factor [Bacteroidales bacterium]
MQKNTLESPVILIVEDHESLRKTLVTWLTDLFPHSSISQASTGEESIALAGRIHPDIILMDIGLPGISGIEATLEICRRGIQTKIVVLTNLDGDIYRQSAFEAGAVEFIAKQEMSKKLPSVLSRLINYLPN